MKALPKDCRLIKKCIADGIGEPDPAPGFRCAGYRTGFEPHKKCRRCRVFVGYKNEEMTEQLMNYNRKMEG